MLRLICAFLFTALLASAHAAAHPGGEPLIHVPRDHVLPGRTFPLIGADLGPDAAVSVKIVRGELSVPLGTVTAKADGHFQTKFVVPSTVPNGYAQLIASASDGTEATTWILVGERTEATGAPPGGTTSRDTAVIVVAAVLTAAGVAAAALTIGFAWRQRRRESPES